MAFDARYRDPDLCRRLSERIRSVRGREIRIMEVCGTHTVSVFRHGIRTMLGESIRLVSGPGCPVCVTDQGDIDAVIAMAEMNHTIVATFGDLMRVPGTRSSLREEKSRGCDVRVVYSAADALAIARANPDRQVVFPGIGFETTAPAIAAAIIAASEEGISNFSVACSHKRVPPALEALAAEDDAAVDGFLLPGHVSVVIGLNGYADFFRKYPIPSVVAGFEPVDILSALLRLAEMIAAGSSGLENAYGRAVTDNGNPRARQVMDTVFYPVDSAWRGLGIIPGGGMALRKAFSGFDAFRRFSVRAAPAPPPAGCSCGDILVGKAVPPDCSLYGNTCTPLDPVGPCMVSSEGTCAAYYQYGGGL